MNKKVDETTYRSSSHIRTLMNPEKIIKMRVKESPQSLILKGHYVKIWEKEKSLKKQKKNKNDTKW